MLRIKNELGARKAKAVLVWDSVPKRLRGSAEHRNPFADLNQPRKTPAKPHNHPRSPFISLPQTQTKICWPSLAPHPFGKLPTRNRFNIMRYLSIHFFTVQILLFSMILPLIATPIPSLATDITGSPNQTATRKRKRPSSSDLDKQTTGVEGAKRSRKQIDRREFPGPASNAKHLTLFQPLLQRAATKWYKIILARLQGPRYKNQNDPLGDREIWTVAIVGGTPKWATLTFRTHLEDIHGARVWKVRSRSRGAYDRSFQIALVPSVDYAVLGRVEMTANTRMRLVDTIDRVLDDSGYSSEPNLLFLDQMLRVTRSEVERMYHKEPKEVNEQVTGMDFTDYVKWTDRFFPEMLRLNGTADGHIIDSKVTEWEQHVYATYNEILQLIESGKVLHDADPMAWVENLQHDLLAIPTLSEGQMDELIQKTKLEDPDRSQVYGPFFIRLST
ncbi:hypothetical protein EV360DRAFT_70192 [Lentinula raphanica]|nr:hypothetical protein EV360DRAFT_70192 [Lentinula raphanica]